MRASIPVNTGYGKVLHSEDFQSFKSSPEKASFVFYIRIFMGNDQNRTTLSVRYQED